MQLERGPDPDMLRPAPGAPNLPGGRRNRNEQIGWPDAGAANPQRELSEPFDIGFPGSDRVSAQLLPGKP